MPSNSLRTAAAIAAVVFTCACVADPPSAPHIGPRFNIDIGIAYPSCHPSSIRSTMATLYTPTDLKRFAIPTFNRAERLSRRGETAAARTAYLSVVDHLLAAYRSDRLQDPSRLTSVQQGVYFVMASVLACAGDPPIDDLATLVVAIGNESPNYQICVVLGTASEATCAVPSGGTATRLEANYLAQEALVILQPDLGDLDEHLFGEELGTTWAALWRLRIEPKTAQRNYPSSSWPFIEPAPKGHAAVCTIEKFAGFHPDLEGDEFLRLGYRQNQRSVAGDVLTESSVATGLLDCATYEHVWQEGPGVSTVSAMPILDNYHGRLALRAVRGSRDFLASTLTPTPLYAFDGGIGGSFLFSDSYYSAVELQRAYIRQNPSTEVEGPLHAVSSSTDHSLELFVARTAYGVVRHPESCIWTSDNTSVTVAPRDTIETLTQYDAHGLPVYIGDVPQTQDVTRTNVLATLSANHPVHDVVVVASCTYRNATSSYSTTVTVTS